MSGADLSYSSDVDPRRPCPEIEASVTGAADPRGLAARAAAPSAKIKPAEERLRPSNILVEYDCEKKTEKGDELQAKTQERRGTLIFTRTDAEDCQ